MTQSLKGTPAMETHAKKRIEMIVEAPLQNRLLRLLDRLPVTGYTVIPALAGRGHGGSWRREGQVTDAGRMIMVICITDAVHAESVVEEVYRLLSRHVGIVTVSEVSVIRAEHF